MTKPTLAVLLVAFFAAGCATDPATATNEQRADPVYRTGSNIAVKNRSAAEDGVVTMSREDVERARTSSMPGGTIPKGN